MYFKYVLYCMYCVYHCIFLDSGTCSLWTLCAAGWGKSTWFLEGLSETRWSSGLPPEGKRCCGRKQDKEYYRWVSRTTDTDAASRRSRGALSPSAGVFRDVYDVKLITAVLPLLRRAGLERKAWCRCRNFDEGLLQNVFLPERALRTVGLFVSCQSQKK